MQIDLHMQLNNMAVQAFPLHKVISGGMTFFQKIMPQ